MSNPRRPPTELQRLVLLQLRQAVTRHDGAVSAMQLADHMTGRRAGQAVVEQTQGRLARLERSGWATRVGRDGRSATWAITPAGIAVSRG